MAMPVKDESVKRSSKYIAKTVDLRKSVKGRITKGKGFKKVQSLNEETGRMNQHLECSICNKTFSKLCNVMDHVRTHLGAKPFACTICGQTFTQCGNRDRHQRKNVCAKRKMNPVAPPSDGF